PPPSADPGCGPGSAFPRRGGAPWGSCGYAAGAAFRRPPPARWRPASLREGSLEGGHPRQGARIGAVPEREVVAHEIAERHASEHPSHRVLPLELHDLHMDVALLQI